MAQLGGSDTEALDVDPYRRQLAEGRPPILTSQVTELDVLSTQLDGCVTPRFRPDSRFSFWLACRKGVIASAPTYCKPHV